MENLGEKPGDLHHFIRKFVKLPCYHPKFLEKYYFECIDFDKLSVGERSDTDTSENNNVDRCWILWENFHCIIDNVQENEKNKCTPEDVRLGIEQDKHNIWSTFRLNATECIQTVLGTPQMNNDAESSPLPLLVGCVAGCLVAILMILALIFIYRRWHKDSPSIRGSIQQKCGTYRGTETIERACIMRTNFTYNLYEPRLPCCEEESCKNVDGEGYEVPVARNEDEDDEEIYTEINETNIGSRNQLVANSTHDLSDNTNEGESNSRCSSKISASLSQTVDVTKELPNCDSDSEQYVEMGSQIYVNISPLHNYYDH